MRRGASIRRVACALAVVAAGACAVPGAAPASVGSFAMAVQSDGKILVAGGSGRVGGGASGKEFGAVVRYEADGSLDRDFGDGDGVALVRQQQPFTAIALQSDGRIVLTSPLGGEGGVARLLPNGRLDGSFGTGGILYAGATSAFYPTSLIVADDGSIFVGGMTGYLNDPGEHWYGRLYRITPDGRSGDWVGSMTGGDGRPGEPKTFLNDFVIGPGGRVIGAGTAAAREPTARSQAALAQLVPSPTLFPGGPPTGPDPSFGAGAGLVTSNFFPASPAPEAANALSWDKGKLLIAGQAGGKFLLARYSAQGILDAGFGRGGIAFNGARGPGNSKANAVAALRGGGIAVAGSRAYACGFEEGCEGPVVGRFKGNGKLDTRFRSRGYARPRIPVDPTGLLFNKEVAYDAVGLSRGRILVGGLASGLSATRFFLRRYLADGRTDRTFGDEGRLTTLPLVAGTPAPGSGR